MNNPHCDKLPNFSACSSLWRTLLWSASLGLGIIVSAVKFKSLHKDHPTALTVSNVGLKQLKFANDFKSSLGFAHSLNSEAKVSLSAGSDGK